LLDSIDVSIENSWPTELRAARPFAGKAALMPLDDYAYFKLGDCTRTCICKTNGGIALARLDVL
jgi:hypothetical protein